jgi:hypothetical protein
MDDNKPKEESEVSNEPHAVYGAWAGKKVRIFNSFREQEEEMIEYWASITPLQRLVHLYEMVKISFRIPDEDARRVHPSKKIRIVKYNP